MMIFPTTKVTCDFCKETIREYLDKFPMNKNGINEDIERYGGLVFGKKHFCNAGCYKDFCDANHAKGEGQ